MPKHEPNPETDPYRPPAIPTEVCCLHCGQEYESYLIQWREETDDRGHLHGFWCCPTPGCDGKGFGFDIFPTDPEYRGADGEPMWFTVDDDEEDEDEAAEAFADETEPFDDSFDLGNGAPPVGGDVFERGDPSSRSAPPPIDLDNDTPGRKSDSDDAGAHRYPPDEDDIPF